MNYTGMGKGMIELCNRKYYITICCNGISLCIWLWFVCWLLALYDDSSSTVQVLQHQCIKSSYIKIHILILNNKMHIFVKFRHF